MAFRVVHDQKCAEFAPNKDVCPCSHDAVGSLIAAVNDLVERQVEVLHALENSAPKGAVPILADPIRQRLRAAVLDDATLITKKMLQNWRAQTT